MDSAVVFMALETMLLNRHVDLVLKTSFEIITHIMNVESATMQTFLLVG